MFLVVDSVVHGGHNTHHGIVYEAVADRWHQDVCAAVEGIRSSAAGHKGGIVEYAVAIVTEIHSKGPCADVELWALSSHDEIHAWIKVSVIMSQRLDYLHPVEEGFRIDTGRAILATLKHANTTQGGVYYFELVDCAIAKHIPF